MLDNGLLQTGLLLAAPFLVPSTLRYLNSFLYPNLRGSRSNGQRLKDSRHVAFFRLFVVTLGVSISLFTALLPPHNLFLSLSKPQSFTSRVFPTLRYPLDIRLATETIHRLWQYETLSRSNRPLNDSELYLIQRLQTLDARLSYLGFGSYPILYCNWCKPFTTSTNSGGGGGGGGDHLISILPGIFIAYLTILIGIGLLLNQNGRERWRIWAVLFIGVGSGNEVWQRLTWEGLRLNGGMISQGQTVSMLHSNLHIQRSILSAVTLLAAYFAPTTTTTTTSGANLEDLRTKPSLRVSTSSIVTPAITGIVQQSEELLSKLRSLSLERMSILHHDPYRQKVNKFWETASRESKFARSDSSIQSLLGRSDLLEARESFQTFLDQSFVRSREGEGGVEEKSGMQAVLTGDSDDDEDDDDDEDEEGVDKQGKLGEN